MKKYLVVVMAVMLLCIGCGNTDTPDTEENTQQTESSVTDQDEETSSATSETTETEVNTEVESEALQAAREYAITKWGKGYIDSRYFFIRKWLFR